MQLIEAAKSKFCNMAIPEIDHCFLETSLRNLSAVTTKITSPGTDNTGSVEDTIPVFIVLQGFSFVDKGKMHPFIWISKSTE